MNSVSPKHLNESLLKKIKTSIYLEPTPTPNRKVETILKDIVLVQRQLSKLLQELEDAIEK